MRNPYNETDYAELAAQILAAAAEAKKIQDRFLSEQTPAYTRQQLYALPQAEKDALQAKYTSWLARNPDHNAP